MKQFIAPLEHTPSDGDYPWNTHQVMGLPLEHTPSDGDYPLEHSLSDGDYPWNTH